MKRAEKILSELESGNTDIEAPLNKSKVVDNDKDIQSPSLFSSQLAEQISKIDVNTITPIEAINILYNLKNQAKKELGDNK